MNSLEKFARGKRDESFEKVLKTKKKMREKKMVELRNYRKIKTKEELNVNSELAKTRKSFYDSYFDSLKEEANIDDEEGDNEAEGTELKINDNKKRKGRGDNENNKDHKKKQKLNPFIKEIIKAEKNKEVIHNNEEDKKKHNDKIKENQKKRHLKTSLLSKKTSKGQPIMKHAINHLLQKLEQGKGVLKK